MAGSVMPDATMPENKVTTTDVDSLVERKIEPVEHTKLRSMLDEYERLSSCPASKIGVYCGYIHKYADWQFAANAQLRLRRSA